MGEKQGFSLFGKKKVPEPKFSLFGKKKLPKTTPTEEGIRIVRQRMREEKEEEFQELKKISKNLCDLVFTQDFNVDEVTSNSYATLFKPYSEIVDGGKSPLYPGGYESKLILKVTPLDKDSPIRLLQFDGFSIVRAGDHIFGKNTKI